MSVEIQPNTAQSVEFLKWRGIEPVLSAKYVQEKGNGGNFQTKAFRAPVDWDAVAKWIDARQGKANIYYAVNPSSGQVDKKTSRADVQAMQWLHVDCDVRPGEDQVEGTKRIVTKLEAYDPPPSYIVQSGGGAQAFWKLEAPVPVDGDITVAEDLKLYNLTLEQKLEGDHCHSLDHIMRLPGTINVPNEGKRKKGRVAALATWAKRSEAVYSLERFPKAEVAAPVDVGFSDSGTYEKIRGDDRRLNGLDAKWVQIGIKGDTEGQFLGADGKTDRSKMALAFVTSCLRAKVDPQVIASILMDPTWLVGECIRDKGGETKRHLKRIVERASKFVEEDFAKPAVLGKLTWTKSAEVCMARIFPDGVIFWRGDWFVYVDGRWTPREEGSMRSALRKFLNESKVIIKVDEESGKKVIGAFNPNNNDVSELLSAMRDLVHLDKDAVEQPCWIQPDGAAGWVLCPVNQDRPTPAECINCGNGILHVPSRVLYPHSNEFFTSNIAQFQYDPSARCPTWLRTLDDYWPLLERAPQEPLLLQEMFGYSLTARTDLQKLLACIGPGRSGKGTIARVLTMLVGSANVAAPTFGSLGRSFGKHALLHKTLAIIGEASFGKKDDRGEITNTLKTISGEDKVTIERKYQTDWEGRLLVRFWLFGNQIPNFEDNGQAFMMRLVPLRMTRSFAEKPNKNLGRELSAEIAGILNWALDGYDRLFKEQGGEFTMPEASMEMRNTFGSLANPLLTFIEDYCVTGGEDDGYATENDLRAAYDEWCEKVGLRPMSQGKFIEALVSVNPAAFRRYRPEQEDGSRPKCVAGLRLRNAAPVRRRNQGNVRPERGNQTADIPF